MSFKASFDKRAIIITILVTILFSVLIGGQYSIISDAGHAVPIYTTTACLLIYFLAFAFRPIGYIITNDELIVRRPVYNVHIRRADIKNVEVIERRNIRGSCRIVGVGGLFGYYGGFANRSLGFMTWYATRKDRMVLVRTHDNKKIIFSPDEPSRFVNDLNF